MADNSIRLFDPLPQNSLLVIRRETEKDSPLVDFENGASLVEEDLDLAILQLLHICQENYDALGGSVAEQYAEDARRTLEECIKQLEECRKEVAKAKAQADRAALEADRAEVAADRADGIADLACGATNLEAVWVTTSPLTRGTVFTLPNGITYFPGRRTLVLHAEGVRWYPGMQYEEVRQTGADASPDATSNQVRILFDLPANIPMHVMVIASNIAKYVTETLERIEQILKEIEELVRRAETAADEAEKARDIAQNAAQEATEQADRAEEAADDAEHAAAAVDRMTRRRGIYTVRTFADLVLVPNAFAIIWAGLPFRILEQHPLIPLEAPVSPEDVPCCPDGFYLGGDPCEGGGGGTEQPPDPEDPDGGDGDDGGLGSIALCGARKKIWQSHVVHTGDDRA